MILFLCFSSIIWWISKFQKHSEYPLGVYIHLYFFISLSLKKSVVTTSRNNESSGVVDGNCASPWRKTFFVWPGWNRYLDPLFLLRFCRQQLSMNFTGASGLIASAISVASNHKPAQIFQVVALGTRGCRTVCYNLAPWQHLPAGRFTRQQLVARITSTVTVAKMVTTSHQHLLVIYECHHYRVSCGILGQTADSWFV